LSESVKIVEKKTVPSEATMIIGLPDVGLVGLIATSYLISELNLEEIAYMDSTCFLPSSSCSPIWASSIGRASFPPYVAKVAYM